MALNSGASHGEIFGLQCEPMWLLTRVFYSQRPDGRRASFQYLLQDRQPKVFRSRTHILTPARQAGVLRSTQPDKSPPHTPMVTRATAPFRVQVMPWFVAWGDEKVKNKIATTAGRGLNPDRNVQAFDLLTIIRESLPRAEFRQLAR